MKGTIIILILGVIGGLNNEKITHIFATVCVFMSGKWR